MISPRAFLTFALQFAALCAFVPSAWSADAPRVALVIGNARYPDTTFKEPVNDARVFAEELRRDGFDVDTAENLTGDAMRRALERLYGRIKPGSVALIFYSGIGIQSGRRTYLIPVDAQIWTEADVRRDGFPLEAMLGEINSRGAAVKIALLDASRRNPFERRFRSFSAGLAPVVAPGDSLVMFSAALSSVAADIGAARGLMVDELLKAMRTSGLSTNEMLDRTRTGVTRASHGEQVPWISSSLAQEFALVPDQKPQAQPPITRPGPIAVLQPPEVPAAGRRVALVIGNSAYASAPVLPNPQRDAADVAATLRAVGFETVVTQTDVSRETLTDSLRSFAWLADNADWAVVYYSGHGMEMAGTNYVIPIDAKLTNDRDVGYEAIPLDQILNAVDGAKEMRLVVLDACRDNPFLNQMRRTMSAATRSIGRGLARVEPEAGTLVVFAAKHGETALDGDANNSPFTTAFLREIRKPGLEVRRLFDLVRDDVMSATKRRQQPYSYGSVPGNRDFYFVAPQ